MRESSGKIDVVAPSSAPMLVIVALPVQLIDSQPGPKYSIILLVPPLTVNSSQTFKMISFGAVHPLSFPVSLMPTNFGAKTSQESPAITSAASAPPTQIATMASPPALGV